MNIDCKVIQDLIPLVNDGVASEESNSIVSEHCDKCRDCKAFLSLEHISQAEIALPNDENIIKNIKRQLNFSKALFAGLGILLASMLWGAVLVSPSLSYVLLVFLIVMPITSFVVTLILAAKGSRLKFYFPLIAGAFGYLTYILWYWDLTGVGILPLLVTTLPAAIGLGIGMIVHKHHSKTAKTNTQIKSKTKVIITTVLSALVIVAIGIGYVSYVAKDAPRYEEQIMAYLSYQGYFDEEISSVKARHSPWNIFRSYQYQQWRVDVIFADEPNIIYYYAFDEKGMMSQTFSGAVNADGLKNLDRHLWIDPNHSKEEIPAETNEEGLAIAEPVPPEAFETNERQARHAPSTQTERVDDEVEAVADEDEVN
jgi:predicted anti-sigma-YlaC factor YlaD